MTVRMFAALLAATLLVLTVGAAPAGARADKDCDGTAIGVTPLNDLGEATYQGEVGGLYPNGSNTVPAGHLTLGQALAASVVPRSADGTPDPNGAIVFTSIGVSNTSGEFDAFTALAGTEFQPTSRLAFVNGAQQGRALRGWASERNDHVWETIRARLGRAGLTPAQVQVAWMMLPSPERGPATLATARAELVDFVAVLKRAKQEFPNLQLVYISSRIYGGYIADANSEPNAYHHGFQMKWLIEAQIDGDPELNADPGRGAVVAPWIAWGPYLWADGTNPRSDGLTWDCADYAADGVHPGRIASEKVAHLLVDHLQSDPTAAAWFEGEQADPTTTSSPTTVPAAPSTRVPSTSSPVSAATTTTSTTPTPVAAESEGGSGRRGAWGAAAVAVLAAAAGVGLLRSGPGRTPDEGVDP